jgi:Ni2+-binding GTPase involved in maturation of urease and hydrogenase
VKLHLVGGFLGSGKTTAIIQAARVLMANGQRVGVVTNDQGRYLVDTAFVRLGNVPTVEVTGGCFCCKYEDLDHSIAGLVQTAAPDVIFAESVGSCADIVATVVKPLLRLNQTFDVPASFSVFADARLLRRRLRGAPMPFSEDVVYIFDKQIEEAGLLVVNKMDLLSTEQTLDLQQRAKGVLSEKNILYQTSIAATGVDAWLRLIADGNRLLPEISLDIDYERYGHGEAQLAWLDEVIILRGKAAGTGLRRLIREMLDSLREQKHAVGHLKFAVQEGDAMWKLSFPTLEEPGWDQSLPLLGVEELRVIVNARVEMPVNELYELFQRCLSECCAEFSVEGGAHFHPTQPNPTHRMR